MPVHQTLARIVVPVQKQVEEALDAAAPLDTLEQLVKQVSD